MRYTLGQAAKATGKAKSTISKAIKSGKLSASKENGGSYQIDAAELHRVFPIEQETVSSEQPETPVSHTSNAEIRIAVLEAELKAAERRAEDLREQVEDLRQDRDDWKKQAQLAITDQRPKRSIFRIFNGQG